MIEADLAIQGPDIQGPAILTPRKFADDRGFFSEVYNKATLAEQGIHDTFVQDNQSLSKQAGTIRGLHFQIAPFAQAKIVRVLRGAIFDVAVDLRHGSPTYGQHVAATLSADNFKQFYIPAGFAHGLCTLEADTEIHYKVSAPYSKEHDCGVAWNDPALAIDWPVSAKDAILSQKDAGLPPLAGLPAYFQYDAANVCVAGVTSP